MKSLAPFAAAVLWLGVVTQGAGALELRGEVVVEDSTVRLGDLFMVAEEKANTVVARAPAPGRQAVFNAARLARIARAHNLMWRPNSRYDRVVVARASRTVDRREIEEALKEALSRQGLAQDARIEIATRNLTIDLPTKGARTIAIRDLRYEPKTTRFHATIVAPAGDPRAKRTSITGRITPLARIPVLSRRVHAGETITEADIEFITIAARRIGRDVIVDAKRLVGMAPKRALPMQRPVRSRDIGLPIVISKGSIVTMILRTPTMLLTAKGRALDNGAKGAAIRIRNTRSRNIIEGVVAGPNRVTIPHLIDATR